MVYGFQLSFFHSVKRAGDSELMRFFISHSIETAQPASHGIFGGWRAQAFAEKIE